MYLHVNLLNDTSSGPKLYKFLLRYEKFQWCQIPMSQIRTILKIWNISSFQGDHLGKYLFNKCVYIFLFTKKNSKMFWDSINYDLDSICSGSTWSRLVDLLLLGSPSPLGVKVWYLEIT